MSLRDIVNSVHGTDTLIPRLKAYVVSKKHQERDGPRTGWHPSDFCDMCPRGRVIGKLTGIKKEAINDRLQRIFDTGTALHEWYQNVYFANMGIIWGKWKCLVCKKMHWGMPPQVCINCGDTLFEYKEVPVFAHLPDCEEPVNGHSDGLIKLRNKWYVLEIKTITVRSFPFLVEAQEAHIKQAQIYAELIRQGLVEDLPSGTKCPRPEGIIILYICKDNSALKEYLVPMDASFAKGELRKPMVVEKALAVRALPEKLDCCTTKAKGKKRKCRVVDRCFSEWTFEDLEAIGKTG